MAYTREEILSKLYRAVMERLANVVRKDVPESGAFQKVLLRGECKGSDFCSVLCVEPSYSSQTKRWITFGVHRKGYDRLVSNYLFKGTKQEILAWLENPENIPQLVEAYGNLEKDAREW